MLNEFKITDSRLLAPPPPQKKTHRFSDYLNSLKSILLNSFNIRQKIWWQTLIKAWEQ